MAIEKTTFVAKVHDLEIESRKKERDLLDTIHDRSSELEGQEKTLSVPRLTPGEVVDMPITDDNMANGTTESMMTIDITNEAGYPIVVSESEQANTNVGLQNARAEAAQIAHKRARNKYIAVGLAGAAHADYRKKLADTSKNRVTRADIELIVKLLDDAEAPGEDRYLLASPEYHTDLMKIEDFISADKMGQGGVSVPTNILGSILGLEVVKVPSARMPVLHATTGNVDTTGKKCIIGYQKYALAYARHYLSMTGPELKAGSASEWWNLHTKQGSEVQNAKYVVTVREN